VELGKTIKYRTYGIPVCGNAWNSAKFSESPSISSKIPSSAGSKKTLPRYILGTTLMNFLYLLGWTISRVYPLSPHPGCFSGKQQHQLPPVALLFGARNEKMADMALYALKQESDGELT
jgi:hypothetical protein